jgi:hypothetical protein
MVMKTNANIVRLAVLGALLAGCQVPKDRATSVSEGEAKGQEVTVVELEPDDQLFKALEAFSKADYKRSATDIKDAAKSMRQIAITTGEKRAQGIETSAEGLESLADKVAHHQVKDIAYLNRAFGKVGRDLAGYRLKISEIEYFNHSEAKSGVSLERTIDQLEKSIATHHRALKPEEKEILNNGLDVAIRLRNGDKIDEADLKSTFQSIDSEITKWNKEFETI